jgi:hypothetical protein
MEKMMVKSKPSETKSTNKYRITALDGDCYQLAYADVRALDANEALDKCLDGGADIVSAGGLFTTPAIFTLANINIHIIS